MDARAEPGPGEEARLVVLAQAGNQRAFGELLRRHEGAVLNVARRIVGDADTAQDVAQEAFITAYRQLPRFRREAAFSTWLYRITVNAARMYVRGQARSAARAERWASSEPTTHADQHWEEQGGRLVQLLQRLPQRQREALALFYLQELSLAQIAQVLGSPEGTVKAWLSRGRERLRQLAVEGGIV